MATFLWEGRARSGEVRRGTVEAENAEIVLNRLKAEQLSQLKVTKKGRGLAEVFSLGTGVSEKDLVIFTRQLSTMIDAGLPLVQAIDILANQTENPSMKKVLLDVKNHVEVGGTFSDALRRHPKIFDDLYVNLVAAGEIGGILDTILQRVGSYVEKSSKLKRKVKGAMTYPISILCVAILVIIVMLAKVIPVFEAMFKEMKSGALPGPTQLVIDLSHGFTDNWYLFGLGGVGVFFLFSFLLKTDKGRFLWDRFILKTPVIGNVLRKVVVARFTRTLGTLLSAGVPILDSMDITARSAGNQVVKNAIMYVRERVSEGKELAPPLGETGVFPPMVVQMIAVGEQTGAMDAMLSKIADFYDDEIDVAVAALTSLLEPIMMVFLGIVVGGLVMAMYLPVFEMAGSVKAD